MSIDITARRSWRTIVPVVAILALTSGTLAACAPAEPKAAAATAAEHAGMGHEADQGKVVALNAALDKLWADHMQYTYRTIDAFFHSDQALQPNLDRLLQNQKDLGAAIVPYYGQEAGDKLAALLTTHIQEAVPVLTAAKAGDDAGLKKSLDDWYANAKDIADFLSAANPENWPASATEPMMKMHIDQTTVYAVDLLKGDHAKAIADYDEAFSHMIDMARTLASGIVAQFPDKF
ncbi:hypothetical protein [Microbacterium sp.]|uniref:hypothetical protein n=1 Tax=Microbacterium sp. TaxID=51671 RepID=UPI003C7631F6